MKTGHKIVSCLVAAVAVFAARAEQSDDWLSVSDDTAVIRTFGTRHILVFTNTASAATVTLNRPMTLEEYLVVGGGGAGGNSISGGGGGGGVVHSDVPQSVAAGTVFAVTVGAGGEPATGTYAAGLQGGHSTLAFGGRTVAGYGGSGGAGFSEAVRAAAVEGEVGSGGGAARGYSVGADGWQWNSAQGHGGVSGVDQDIGGGGGGAGGAADLDYGGEGLPFAISGESVVYGSGGGAGLRMVATLGFGGRGGTNAGSGGVSAAVTATPGVDGTGGGGGGGGHDGTTARRGARGGSGAVILVFSEAGPDVSRLVVQPIGDQLLVSSSACPPVTVRDAASGEVLPESAYAVTYSGNTSAGRAVAVVQGSADTAYAGYTAVCPFEVHAVAYEDDNIIASDAGVGSVVVGDRHVYVFTNASGKVVFRTKRMLTRDRMLLVGGGGSGGGVYGGGGGGGGYVAADGLSLVDPGSEGVLRVGAGAAAHPARNNHGAHGRQGGHSWLSFGGGTLVAYGGGGATGYGTGNEAPKAAVEGEIGSGGGGGSTLADGNYWNSDQGHACGDNPGGNARAGGGGAGADGRTVSTVGVFGGEGVTNDITGAAVVYGSGGGGCPPQGYPEGAGRGGTNAGEGHPMDSGVAGGPGLDGTGAGGGGGSNGDFGSGGDGGSGAVVLSFLVGDHVHYRDEFILTDDLSVRRINKQGSVVYVFTNAADAAFQVTALRDLRIVGALLVGGGGGGGNTAAGGGGGGGVVFTNRVACRVAEGAGLSLRVGAGGEGVTSTSQDRYPSGLQGGASSLTGCGLSLVAFGGGGGAGFDKQPGSASAAGEIGSGGGASNNKSVGTVGVQWQQGSQGGRGTANNGGGGGGAGEGGHDATGGFAGGEGLVNAITGGGVAYGSGGGGGARFGATTATPGAGGANAGAGGDNCEGFPGLDGTGAGGGGGGYTYGGGYSTTNWKGGRGGCGTVILEVKPVYGLCIIVR